MAEAKGKPSGVEQATAAPGEKRAAAKPAEPVDAQDRGKPGSEPEQPQRPGGVDGVKDQADAREAAAVTPVPVGGGAVPAESSDPAVHFLMAERETARINGDDEAVKDVDRRLREAGYDVR